MLVGLGCRKAGGDQLKQNLYYKKFRTRTPDTLTLDCHLRERPKLQPLFLASPLEHML